MKNVDLHGLLLVAVVVSVSVYVIWLDIEDIRAVVNSALMLKVRILLAVPALVAIIWNLKIL